MSLYLGSTKVCAYSGPKETKFITPYAFDYHPGYVAASTGVWTYENSTNNSSDFYHIVNGHTYIVLIGDTVGSRFRVATLQSDPYGSTSNISGTNIKSLNNPPARTLATFTAVYDGYLAITKDNAYTTKIKSYLVDVTPTT